MVTKITVLNVPALLSGADPTKVQLVAVMISTDTSKEMWKGETTPADGTWTVKMKTVPNYSFTLQIQVTRERSIHA